VTAEFFDRISTTPQPLLHDVDATILIALDDHDRGDQTWLLRIDHGRVHVSRRTARADAVIRTDRAIFERVVTGEANGLTAALRGRMRIEGDVRLLVAFVRLMPGPPGRATIVPAADRTARESARTVKAAGTATRTAKVSAAAARMTRKDRTR
jgi:predicted lipid carrier protein YhbT